MSKVGLALKWARTPDAKNPGSFYTGRSVSGVAAVFTLDGKKVEWRTSKRLRPVDDCGNVVAPGKIDEDTAKGLVDVPAGGMIEFTLPFVRTVRDEKRTTKDLVRPEILPVGNAWYSCSSCGLQESVPAAELAKPARAWLEGRGKAYDATRAVRHVLNVGAVCTKCGRRVVTVDDYSVFDAAVVDLRAEAEPLIKAAIAGEGLKELLLPEVFGAFESPVPAKLLPEWEAYRREKMAGVSIGLAHFSQVEARFKAKVAAGEKPPRPQWWAYAPCGVKFGLVDESRLASKTLGWVADFVDEFHDTGDGDGEEAEEPDSLREAKNKLARQE